MAKIAGVDEAGRGCVIGPLVVSAVQFEEATTDLLPRLGVKDSKALSPQRRETLAIKIRELADRIAYFDLEPWAIDKVVNRGQKLRKLNYLEAMAMAKTIRDIHPDRVFIDTADVLPDRFKGDILRVLGWEPDLICEKKADVRYPVVSAASILAKVRRDSFIAQLRDDHGDFGSGYPSDRKTVAYLESWFEGHSTPPPFVRASWKTVKRLVARRQWLNFATTKE